MRTCDSKIHVLILLVLLLVACKTKHVDSEPTFTINFNKNKNWKEKKFCFESIHGQNHDNIGQNCIDSLNYTLKFPINIASKTSTYIFEQARKMDTLTVQYEVEVGSGEYEFQAYIKKFSIKHSTFDSLTVKIEKKPNSKNENASIDIYY